MRTMLLDRATWDLVVDARGNIAVADEPYALAQDAASAVKLFKGELWYNKALGIPYFGRILGRFPPLAFVRARMVDAALRVPGVVSAKCYFDTIQDRTLTGQIQVTDKAGVTTAASF